MKQICKDQRVHVSSCGKKAYSGNLGETECRRKGEKHRSKTKRESEKEKERERERKREKGGGRERDRVGY